MAFACKSRKPTELAPSGYLHVVTLYQNGSTVSGSLYIYTTSTCDEMRFLDIEGNSLSHESSADKAHYSCQLFDNAGLMTGITTANDEQLWMTLYSNANISLASGACSKFMFSPIDKWKDSIPVIMWTEIDTTRNKLKLCYAELQLKWPYHKRPLLDSLIYNYPGFCSKEDLEEEQRSMQAIYEKNLKVEVSPNPFTESFNLELRSGRMKNSTYLSSPMTISFYDEQGNVLFSQPIEVDQPYTFSFPELPKGKTVYYRINIGDYSLSGQVLKSQ